MSKQNPLVLIVEDVESNYLYLQAVLTKITNNVVWVENGVDAVKYVKENAEIDIILMDLQMPVMDGYRTTEIIRSWPEDKYQQLPIIALSASAMDEFRQRAFEVGMNGYITKPFLPKDLFQTIERYAKLDI